VFIPRRERTVRNPPDRKQFRFHGHDAGGQRLPAVQVRHGQPDRLGGALQQLRQRVSQHV
jgi:hypothetical protein